MSNWIAFAYPENGRWGTTPSLFYGFDARDANDPTGPGKQVTEELVPVYFSAGDSPSHINRAIVQAVVARMAERGFTIEDQNVIFVPVDRG